MKILIVGGTRFIGQPVARRLAEAGHEVAVFHRGKNRGKFPAGVSEILGDRRDLESLVE